MRVETDNTAIETILCPKKKVKIPALTCLQNRYRSRKQGRAFEFWSCLGCMLGSEFESRQANLAGLNPANLLYDTCPVCGCPKLKSDTDCGIHKNKDGKRGITVRREIREEDPDQVSILPFTQEEPPVFEDKITLETDICPNIVEELAEPGTLVDPKLFKVPFEVKWEAPDLLTCGCGMKFHPYRYRGLLSHIRKLCPECFHQKRVDGIHNRGPRKKRKPAEESFSGKPIIAEGAIIESPPQSKIQPVFQENRPQAMPEGGGKD